MITTLIFDAEGVVIDTEEMWDRAQAELLKEAGQHYDRETVKPLLTGRSALEGARALKELHGLSASVEAISRRRNELVAGHLERGVALVPGFALFFSYVSGRFKTAIATSMDCDLFDLADRRLGLRRLFRDRFFTLEDVGHRSKPAPDLFLCAARSLGSSPRECAVIEDAPLGIEAARRADMRCIALATTYPRSQLAAADVVVSSFSEIDLSALDSNWRQAGLIGPD